MRLYTVAEMVAGRGWGLGGRKRGVGRHRLQVVVAAKGVVLCDCAWGRREEILEKCNLRREKLGVAGGQDVLLPLGVVLVQ